MCIANYYFESLGVPKLCMGRLRSGMHWPSLKGTPLAFLYANGVGVPRNRANAHPGRHFLSLPPEVRHEPVACLGDAMARKEVIWLRCDPCRHTAVNLPQILAKLVDYGCTLCALRKRMMCRECGGNTSAGSARMRSGERGELSRFSVGGGLRPLKLRYGLYRCAF